MSEYEAEATRKPAAQQVDGDHSSSAPPKSSGGAFEDAKKYFPATAQPAAPKPGDAHTPQPLGLEPYMQLHGVVGRSSLDTATKLTNPNEQAVSLRLGVSGPDFYLRSNSGGIESQAGDNVTDVFVGYAPTRPGTTHGRLQIASTFEGETGPAIEQHIEIEGTAASLEHLEPAPADGSPRAIPDLSSEPKATSPREQANHDLDAASGLAETYTTIVGAGDAAASEMLRRIDHTTFAFGQQVERWVDGELAGNKSSERSPAWKALGVALGKGLDAAFEKLEMGSVATMAAGWVAEKAFDGIVELAVADHEATAKKAAGRTADEGGKELVAATNARVHARVGPLVNRLATTRAVARQLAGHGAMLREAAAQKSLASKQQPYEHESTVTLMNDLRDALGRYDDAVRAIAATATQLEPRLVRSFDELRMSYLKMRADKSSDLTYRVDYFGAWDLGSEASHARETVRMFEPVVSGYSHVSEAMRGFIAHRKLSDFAQDADISVQLDCKQGGGIVIEKKVGKEPTFRSLVGSAAIPAALRGPQGVWKFLDENIG
ncbi:MAG: hypothetical protein ABI467_08245 [Kofleriaceae bacterium]